MVTPRGVASFARARLSRLWLIQSIMALVATLVMAWVVHRAWFPVISESIHQLPQQGQIRDGILEWHRESPCLLTEGHWLAISVDTNDMRAIRSPADLQVELGSERFSFRSLLGHVEGGYPRDWTIELNRTRLEPKWGAWKPILLAGGALVMLAVLMVNWTILATIYFLPLWLMGYFLNRDLNFRASWKLCGAALMPGALVLTLGIFLYGLALIDPVQLTAVFVTHFAIGWIYVLMSVPFLPKHPEATKRKGNPFTGGTSPSK
jgi:hypothetical protein